MSPTDEALIQRVRRNVETLEDLNGRAEFIHKEIFKLIRGSAANTPLSGETARVDTAEPLGAECANRPIDIRSRGRGSREGRSKRDGTNEEEDGQ